MADGIGGAGTGLDAGLAAEIDDAVAGLRGRAVERLSALVAEDSTLGREAGAQALMAESFAALGLAVDRFDVDPGVIADAPGFSPPVHDTYRGRPNVVGVHTPRGTPRRGTGGGRSLILNGHIDVVPPGPSELWASPPFSPSVREGRLYGRGAADMKAGLVANLIALEALAAIGHAPAAPVILQSVIEEECTGNGALACLARGYRADAAIIPEPFAQSLMTAQLGVMWMTVRLTGKPAHVLDTSAGANAIEAAYALFARLKRLEAAWNEPAARHPAYADHRHPVNFNLGRITGGDWASTVPCEAVMTVRVGFYPGTPLADVRADLVSAVRAAVAEEAGLAGIRAEISWRGFQAEGCVVDPASDLMAGLAAAHRAVAGGEPARLASTATTDVRFFTLYGGMPATCYGPVGGSLHGIDEWVSLDSVVEVTKVLARFTAAWCGLEKR